MKRYLSIALLCILAGCDSKPVQPELSKLSASQVEDARRSASVQIGAKGRALFICGPSNGLSIHTEKWDDGFLPDGMKDGRMIFVVRSDGRHDLVFRDATGIYFSELENGGEVRRISDSSREIESWVIVYPATGFTETHNIVKANGEQLVDMWTLNKPPLMIGATVKVFKAGCVRP
jgi:hypothetical protein